jgi:hypothetical protein
LLPEEAPENPDKWQDVMTDIEKIIMPGVTHWHSPRFHAYFPTANSYPAIVADMLSGAIACIGFTWVSHTRPEKASGNYSHSWGRKETMNVALRWVIYIQETTGSNIGPKTSISWITIYLNLPEFLGAHGGGLCEHYTASRKIASSIPNEVMALRSEFYIFISSTQSIKRPSYRNNYC